MDIGHKIIAEIVKQGMFAVNHPDPDMAHVFVWSSGAPEQLHALVSDSAEVQIPRREAALYGQALQLLGAPDNGNPADATMNTWHFKTNDVGSPADQAGDCIAHLAGEFYNNIDVYYSNFCSGAVEYKAFDLSDPEPRVPVVEGTTTMSVGDNNGLPCEVAVCLSFQADRVSGTPQARRRGRVYIGPLWAAQTVVADTGSGDMIVDADFRSALATNAAGLAGVFVGSSSGSSIAWCVFSPTMLEDGATLSQASNNVTNGWIDFAIDIQRRRGHAPGGRTLWTA